VKFSKSDNDSDDEYNDGRNYPSALHADDEDRDYY
jgi:hypothetical protein